MFNLAHLSSLSTCYSSLYQWGRQALTSLNLLECVCIHSLCVLTCIEESTLMTIYSVLTSFFTSSTTQLSWLLFPIPWPTRHPKVSMYIHEKVFFWKRASPGFEEVLLKWCVFPMYASGISFQATFSTQWRGPLEAAIQLNGKFLSLDSVMWERAWLICLATQTFHQLVIKVLLMTLWKSPYIRTY